MNFSSLAPYVVLGLAGVAVAAQPAFNGQLAGHLGSPLRAALVNFTAGMLVLAVVVGAMAMRGGLPTARQIASVPLHLWVVGGTLGAMFVTTLAWSAPRVGVGATFAVVIASQFVAVVALDHFGLIGLDVRPVTLMRLAGGAMLIAGAFFVVKG